MVHGPFHGDMHAGNIWALDDGRTCFLDFGIMGELPDDWKQVMKDLFYTCSFDLDFVRIARSYRGVGAIPAGVGTDEELGAVIEAIFGPLLTDGFGNLDIAALVTQSLELLKLYDATVPRELVLIGKQFLYVERYMVLLPPGHRLGARAGVKLTDRVDEPYVDRLACEMREQVAAACASRRFQLYAAHRTEREEWVQSLVQAGLGFAFMPEHSILPGETITRPLTEPALARTISMLRNADRPPTSAAKLFWQNLLGKA